MHRFTSSRVEIATGIHADVIRMCMCVRWQCTKSHAYHAKATAERWRPNDARAYIRPLAVHQVPRLPCKSHRQSGGDQGTPGRTSDSLAVHQVPRLRRKTHRQSGGYQGTPGRTSDLLHCTKSHACHAKATGRAAETKGRQGVHPTPCSAPSPTPAMQKPPAERRRPRDASVHPTPCSAPGPKPATQKPPAERRRPRDARAYIRLLAVHQVPNLPRKSHRQSGKDQGTPGRTSDSLQRTKCRTCHAKPTGRAAETKGRQGVHPTPCNAPSAAPATQNPPAERRRPRDARGVHPTPWRSTKCRACHAKAVGRAAETKGRQGIHPTPRSAPSEWEWVSAWVCVMCVCVRIMCWCEWVSLCDVCASDVGVGWVGGCVCVHRYNKWF